MQSPLGRPSSWPTPYLSNPVPAVSKLLGLSESPHGTPSLQQPSASPSAKPPPFLGSRPLTAPVHTQHPSRHPTAPP